jgi:hypothetical protein
MHHLNKTLKLGFNKKIDGVAHNALDDAKGQAMYVMQIQEGLNKMKSSWVLHEGKPYFKNTFDTASLF